MAKITHKGNKPVKVCYDEWISCLEDYKNSGKSLESWLEGVKDYSPTETYTGEEMRTAKNYYFLTYANKITELIAIKRIKLEGKI